MNRSRVLLVAPLAIVATVAGLITSIPSALAVPPQQITFAGGAFATNISVGDLVKVGKTGSTGLCTRYPGQTASNSTAAVTLPQLGNVGAVQTQTNSALDANNNPVSTASAQTAATSLLGGLVSFDAVTSNSSLTRATDGTVTTSGSSVFVGLSVNGNPFNLTPPKNTVVNLAGIATLRFNTQAKTSTFGTDSFRVTALTISLLPGNTLRSACRSDPDRHGHVGHSRPDLRQGRRVGVRYVDPGRHCPEERQDGAGVGGLRWHQR